MAKWDLSKLKPSTRNPDEEFLPEPTFATRMDKVESLFRYQHLPAHLQEASKPFHVLATHLVETLPESAECTLALRSLWEAKNLAVFAKGEAAEKENA